MRSIKLLLLGALTAFAVSCSNDNGISSSEVTAEVTLPSGLENVNISEGTFTFTNKNSQVVREYTYPLNGVSIADGVYDVKFVGAGTFTKTATAVRIQGLKENLVVEGGKCDLDMVVYVYEDKADFVISEIYYSGSAKLLETGKYQQYNGDQYIVIHNNSDQVLYADGLGVVESAFNTTTKYDYTPDVMSEALTVDMLFVIPGSGTDHPVEPGGKLVLCDNGLNHKIEANDPSFMNLENADFEWFVESSVTSQQDVDTEVPNLDIYYSSSNSIYLLTKGGRKTYGLVRMEQDKDTWLANHTYQAYYINILGNPTTPRAYYKVPNEWVIDAVTVSPPKTHAWMVCDPSLDIGYTWCLQEDEVTVAYGESIQRKALFTNPDGTQVLQKTNNSFDDFNRNCVPSMR